MRRLARKCHIGYYRQTNQCWLHFHAESCTFLLSRLRSFDFSPISMSHQNHTQFWHTLPRLIQLGLLPYHLKYHGPVSARFRTCRIHHLHIRVPQCIRVMCILNNTTKISAHFPEHSKNDATLISEAHLNFFDCYGESFSGRPNMIAVECHFCKLKKP